MVNDLRIGWATGGREAPRCMSMQCALPGARLVGSPLTCPNTTPWWFGLELPGMQAEAARTFEALFNSSTDFHPVEVLGNQEGPAGARPQTWCDGGGGGI